MAIKSVRYHVLNVGQGQGNYIEIVDDKGSVVHNILIDLGSSSKAPLSAKNLKWLNDAIGKRPDPRIDVVLLTHGDADHYSLISGLEPGLGAPDKKRIGMVRYGNPSWRYLQWDAKTREYKSTIEFLDKYCGAVTYLPSLHSGFSRIKKTWTPLWKTAKDEVKLQLVMVNVPHPKLDNLLHDDDKMNSTSHQVNMESLVSALEWNNSCFLSTGDATGLTLQAINNLFLNRRGEYEKTGLPSCLMMTLPHHGSRLTTFDLARSTGNITDEWFIYIADFVKLFEPKTITASADERFYHPHIDVIMEFVDYLDPNPYWHDENTKSKTKHFLTSYIDYSLAGDDKTRWPGRPAYLTTQTDCNVYTTRYFDDTRYNTLVKRPEVVVPKKLTGKRKRESKDFYPRYVYPPDVGELATGNEDAPLTGVPSYHNWTFEYDDTGELKVTATSDTATFELNSAPRIDFAAPGPPIAASQIIGPAQRRSAVPAAADCARRPSARPSWFRYGAPRASRLGNLRSIS